MLETFNHILIENLLISEEDHKTISEVKYRYNSILKEDLSELNRLTDTHNGIAEYYKKIANGWELTWKKQGDTNIGGKIQLATTNSLFSDSNLYSEGDDEDLQYFRPLDYPTPESYVGFIIKPDTIYQSVYYMSVSDYELYNLDLDYEGYTQMAVEARVFNHWQTVLLYYMGDTENGSSETETFKTEMPKIFPEWTWDNFIDKFESLRLSNRTTNN